MNIGALIGIAIFFLPLLILIINLVLGKKRKKAFEDKLTQSSLELKQTYEKLANVEIERNELVEKYSPILDTENYAAKLLDDIEEDAAAKREQSLKLLSEAGLEADEIRDDAKQLRLEASQRVKDSKEKAETIKNEAREEASKIISFADAQAREIAGDAYEAKAKADSYDKAIRAMRNTIDGYKDDYIIPNHSVLDDLADEFGHKEAGDELKAARKRVREMVKNGYAGACDYAELHRKTYAIHFAVDAFNGKVDSALSKVKHDNYGKIKQEVIDAFALVNHNGNPFRNARINQEYLDARLNELKWAVATFELKKIEREEQAEIKAQIREEERAIREMEKARKEAEKEEHMLQKALEKARSELAAANDEQRSQFETQLAELEEKLKEAEDKGQRALSMAQQTRRGHVYVISNIGSFGEKVFKIGMTRRLEPMDRVKELGDASVPFSFDVHAMIYSEDAPTLEKELHRKFDLNSVNKVNPRKEFFRTTIAEIKRAVEQQGVSDVHWTLKAEASEYRESIAIAKEQLSEAVA
ncbi:DUF4041 domain-containing protein [Vibrio hepatarius]|uniref:DUF4041 domain-containing protein n=1 Tax=Vibrio hepatarius TaxID=171383 RepID=UPI001C0A65E4|nr:DUF4041 domain-containing protein [Vibrio hepatarius]MBU2895462.1 DUF4041 domain-containing protein [Vibrio hepatarius]